MIDLSKEGEEKTPLFIANPDLVARFRAGAPLAKPDYTLLYTGEERGYTDYPNYQPAGS